MYENGNPFFKKWNVVVLRERGICYFDTSVKVFMKFVKDSFGPSKRKTYSNSGAYKISSRRLVCNSGILSKSCETLL